MTAGSAAPTTRIDRVLGGIERAGDRIPEPFALFLGLFALLGLVSTVMALARVTVQVPGAAGVNPIRGLLTRRGRALGGVPRRGPAGRARAGVMRGWAP